MKKVLYFALFIFMFAVLMACNQESANDETKEAKDSDDKTAETVEKDEESINVDKGLLNVEVTLPASFFEGEDINQVINNAKADGVKEVTQNEDGSLTYKMSKSDHNKIMEEMEKGILDTIEETKTSEDYVSIKDVKHNKSFDEYTLIVNRESYENSFDGFAVFGLGLAGLFYQAFNGTDPEDYKVTIFVEDEATGEVFNTTIYPDALNEQE